MPQQPDKKWQPPPYTADPREKIAWLNDIISASENDIITKPAANEMKWGIDMISGRLAAKISESRSRLTINRAKRNLREVIASIADVRCIDGFATDNDAFKQEASMRNLIWKAVYFESRFAEAVHTCAQWFSVGGYSYISPVYRNLKLSGKDGNAEVFDVFPACDCIPFQLPQNYEVQGAYAWTIFRYMPLFEAHAKWPRFQHLLRPISRRRYSGDASKDRIGLAQMFRQIRDYGASSDIMSGGWAEQMCEIRFTYVNDLAINTSGMPIAMGPAGANYSYVVPFVGQMIPTVNVSKTGKRELRKATEEDCYLYPNKRLMVSQRGMDRDMSDGPSYNIHGKFPLARYSADKWPWEPGYSIARDIYSIEDALQKLDRGMEQTSKARFDPGMMYDKNAGIPKKTMEQFDPFEERGRLGVDGEVKETIMRPVLSDKMMDVPAWAFDLRKEYIETSNYLLGMDALANLAKAKIAMSTGAAEKAMEEVGPVVKDIARGMEQPTAEIMEMTMLDVAQNYPVGRLMAYIGANKITPSTFDYDPKSLVPSHGPDENPKNGDSIYTKAQRIKSFFGNIPLMIAPGSLHSIVQTEQKLLLMQMFRAGLPISPDTVMKAADIQNVGEIEGNTEIEKFFSWKKMLVETAAQIQQLQASLAPPAPPQPGGAPPQEGSVGAPTPQPGRPPSGNKPPTAVTKGSAEGPRLAVTES